MMRTCTPSGLRLRERHDGMRLLNGVVEQLGASGNGDSWWLDATHQQGDPLRKDARREMSVEGRACRRSAFPQTTHSDVGLFHGRNRCIRPSNGLLRRVESMNQIRQRCVGAPTPGLSDGLRQK